ncbi:beta-glucosidase [Paracoccus limosus]|uniref:Beta-glucosidase n=1 Tax=Paracoccus limosus TaxID=913252 RepID=A0A844H6R2_9RHOB|nr:glucoamylase family protein [Paracoccus limosus]MTH35314.1 beta-glucosidase [Paracoccus limosus]
MSPHLQGLTPPDSAPPNPNLPEAALLDAVQRQTLRYFWDFGHPVSGMARERSGGAASYDTARTVTTGGTGFGIMAMIAGTERGWIARPDLIARLTRICDFLGSAPRYRGAFAHWMDGATAETIAFSANDTGGDIVETAFLMMGLLTARQYVVAETPALAASIDRLWQGVDWAGYCPRPDQLMWHWRPGPEPWKQALQLRGWHEALIAFVLGAGAPRHPLPPDAYRIGWKNSPTFPNGRSYYGITLPLGPDLGGPLFFSHYSFLGLDPRGLTDASADYWMQNRAQTLINHAHCQANPHGFRGYGPAWGLSACDCEAGYDAFSPANDRGTIAITAALSAMPYAPDLALAALRHYAADTRLWGPLGFYDAFNPDTGWVAQSHLAIDQGPIVVMIENYRSGLLWRLFMSAPEVRAGLDRLGFHRPQDPPPPLA